MPIIRKLKTLLAGFLKSFLFAVASLPVILASETATADTQPLTVLNSGLNDAWVSVDAPFQGMFITVFPDLGLVFLAWFTFDSETPASGNTAVQAGAFRPA